MQGGGYGEAAQRSRLSPQAKAVRPQGAQSRASPDCGFAARLSAFAKINGSTQRQSRIRVFYDSI